LIKNFSDFAYEISVYENISGALNENKKDKKDKTENETIVLEAYTGCCSAIKEITNETNFKGYEEILKSAIEYIPDQIKQKTKLETVGVNPTTTSPSVVTRGLSPSLNTKDEDLSIKNLQRNGREYTPLEAAKERITEAKEGSANLAKKIKDGKIKLGDPNKARFNISEEDIIKYSAKGILSKALRAKAIEEIAATQEGKKKNLVNKITFETVGNTYNEATDGSGNLKIQFGRRYARKDFTGGETTKLEFNDPNFGNNSFANCTFTNCDFTGSSGKQLKFVNCTFGGGCVIPKDLKTSKMNFAGCKFSADIFNGLSEAEAGELKRTLGIDATTAESEGYFSSKPNPSVTSAAAFKLNPKMLTR
jgi:hypothetical protein